MEDTGDEIKRLQGCLNDLISVLPLPAIWGGHESSQMAGILLDVLLPGLSVKDFLFPEDQEFAYEQFLLRDLREG
jgi:hypothetical protein